MIYLDLLWTSTETGVCSLSATASTRLEQRGRELPKDAVSVELGAKA